MGYLAYDLGRRFEHLPGLARVDQHLPLLRLALHDWVLAWDRMTGTAWLATRMADGDGERQARRIRDVLARLDDLARGVVRAGDGPTSSGRPVPQAFVSGTPHAAWLAGVEAVRDAIGRGDIYQANLTRRLEAPFAGDPWPVFRRLRTGDPALFAGYLDVGPSPSTGAPRALLSASPEPFLAVDAAGRVSTDPIKGTRPRGRTREEDHALARELLASGKDQAENVMIVDVLRNDLGRVCVPGSIRVPRLLRLERSAAVQHLVTTVTGRLDRTRTPSTCWRRPFPAAASRALPRSGPWRSSRGSNLSVAARTAGRCSGWVRTGVSAHPS